tara:strand:- start:1048 stop:1488 length:441 start_codon:yes stop_codon:yes gene_type:complete
MEEEGKTIDIQEKITDFGQRELGDVKVMMVEDDPFVTELVLHKLSKQGCIPYSITDGTDVINTALQFQPNVIILDLMLPGAQGEDILTTLKEHETLKDIPVVVFSNKSTPQDIDRCKSLGASEYFVKSSTELNDLAMVIKKLTKGE